MIILRVIRLMPLAFKGAAILQPLIIGIPTFEVPLTFAIPFHHFTRTRFTAVYALQTRLVSSCT